MGNPSDRFCFLLPGSGREPVTRQEMRTIEERGAILGISRLLMMENAGSSVADFIACLKSDQSAGPVAGGQLREETKEKILLVAGTGNNGGDTFVAARHLAFRSNDFNITIILVGNSSDIKAEEASYNWNVVKKISSIQTSEVGCESELPILEDRLKEASVAVVGIFGTGFSGSPRDLQRRVIELINASRGCKVISVDLPSGLEADSGDFDTAVRSDYTITMHAPKIGMIRNERAKQICGRILIANIGIPQ